MLNSPGAGAYATLSAVCGRSPDWTGRVAAVKLHAQLDLRGPLPARVLVTEGGQGDAAWLDDLPVEPGAYYLMNRGHVDLQRWRRIATSGAYFDVRERDDVLRYVSQSGTSALPSPR